MKHGKNYENAAKKIEAGKSYEVADALALVVDTATAKFDETVEIHVRLGVDPRSADQQVRGSVVLPNGTGKTKKVLVIAKGDKADAAKAAGADIVGAEEIVDKIMKVNAKQRVVMVDLPCLPKCIDIFVYDIDMNLLFWQNNMTFIRSISTRVEVASVTFKVEKDVDGEKVTEKYSKYSAEGNTMSNGQKYYDGYFYKLPILKKDTKGSLDFIYFDGNKENKEQNKIDARNMVLEIINRAKEECYICDPYFAAKDFQKYIWPIRSLKVKIKILNCKEQLDSIKGRFPDIYTSLASELNYYNSALPTEKVNIRTIQGQGELHDRFIIADDEGWVVGSSFNELGNRSTTINRIPPSQVKVVKQQIEKWWNESKDINDING